MTDKPRTYAVLLLSWVAVAAALWAVSKGSVSLSWSDWASLWRADPLSVRGAVLWELRVPRVASAFAAGALLALAGVLLQALLRNPLADPYVLGVSGGASVAVLAVFALSGRGVGLPVWAMQAAAAGGAACTLVVLFALARRAFFSKTLLGADEGSVTVLLTGVMLAAFFGALVSVLLALAGDSQLRGMVFWLLGDLTGATDMRLAAVAFAILMGCVWVAYRRAGDMSLMLRGDVLAFTQGVDVVRTRRVLVLTAALATGAAVSLAGAIGFVGFVAPHLMRLWVGHDQRVLVLASVLAGGTLVVVADTVARTIVAPIQLPVGVVTALVGVPLFLWWVRYR